MARDEDIAELNWLERLLRNPAVNAIAWIATVVGFGLSIYFYVQSTKKRDLVYYVNPAQAVVVKTGEASNLHVFFAAQEVKSDVTAAQIAVWNQGNDSIRPDNVLEQVVIHTNPSVPILEASIRKKSRGVVDVSIDQSRLSEGIVGVKWNIFEQNDGAVIQIVYAGPPSNEIQASGVIEGQGTIRLLGERKGKPKDSINVAKTSGFVFLGLGVIMSVFAFGPIFLRNKREQQSPSRSFPRVIFSLLPLVYFLMGLYEIFYMSPPNPPFGF